MAGTIAGSAAGVAETFWEEVITDGTASGIEVAGGATITGEAGIGAEFVAATDLGVLLGGRITTWTAL